MIGSSAKWARFRKQLIEAGHDATVVDLITCPIGSPELVGKEPAVIAVGVAAALLPDLLEATSTRAAARKTAEGVVRSTL